MFAATLNGAFIGSVVPAAIWVGRANDARILQRASQMRQQAAFARSARWVGGSNDLLLTGHPAHIIGAYRSFGDNPRRPMANRILERGLRIRILTGFSLVIFLTLLIAGWSYYSITSLGRVAENVFIANYRSIQYAHRMEHAVDALLDSRPGSAAIRSTDAAFHEALDLEFHNITERGELEAARTIEASYKEFYTALISGGTSNLTAMSSEVMAAIERMLRLNERAMFARSDAMIEKANIARTSTLVITGLLVSIAILLAVAVSRRSLAEFQELDRAKSNFVATAAHELKNPLSAIKTTSALLRDGIAGPISEKQAELVTSIQTESNRLLSLVGELLDLAKLETGTLELQRSVVDADTLIESAIMPIAMHADRANVGIDIVVMPDVPELSVDPNKMAWAITNLLSNAIQYSPRGASVEIRASAIEREVWLSVTDHGKGIPEKDIERIFEKFAQVEAGAMGAGSGSGLGLAIAREIVQAHGGRIWATSSLGQGSTFTIALPLTV
ncbi:MAG: ATP-binding protein [Bacteroidota bacterium]|nr:ATP-binding protein [Bacteroidota bacterium]MDP4233305.1 ATP-binding protein [Bacteroidota bacterium]MDP4242075.1 ATP-binding protein [Bacteroidota bacterium]MDP4288647.1 ATP-binding protein [Bacteroidota bacterium]